MSPGKWICGVSAGGCRNDIDSFATNPQFLLHLKKPGKLLKNYQDF
jgi:hypothetical protein